MHGDRIGLGPRSMSEGGGGGDGVVGNNAPTDPLMQGLPTSKDAEGMDDPFDGPAPKAKKTAPAANNQSLAVSGFHV